MAFDSPAGFDPLRTPDKVVALFNEAVKDDEEQIDENQLKSAIDSLFYVSFSIRTVRLLMYFVTSKYDLIIGLEDYTQIYLLLKPLNDVFNSLKEPNGLIEPSKAKEGLASVGTTVSDDIFNLLIYNFTKRGSSNTLTFGNFVECRLTIEGLKNKYDEIKKDASTADLDDFMLNILPFAIS